MAAGSGNDDIDRLLADMQRLNAEAGRVLGPGDSSASTQPPAPASSSGASSTEVERQGLSAASMEALVVSGVAAGVVAFVWLIVPFIGLTLFDALAVFLGALLTAAWYTLRRR
jgi:hypothetical protein